MQTPRIMDFSHLELRGDVMNFLELRMENDGNGNPIYIGYSKKINAGTDVAVWFIVKITYDGNQSPTHQQLPNRGLTFDYIWDDRATFF